MVDLYGKLIRSNTGCLKHDWIKWLLCIVPHVTQNNMSKNIAQGFTYMVMVWEDQRIFQYSLLL